MHTSSHIMSKGRSDWTGGLSPSELSPISEKASSVRSVEKILWRNTSTMDLKGKSPEVQLEAIWEALKINIGGMDTSGKSRNALINDCIGAIEDQLDYRECVALITYSILKANILDRATKEVMEWISQKK